MSNLPLDRPKLLGIRGAGTTLLSWLTTRPWTFTCIAIFLIATAAYVPYELYFEDGPRGGSWPGLLYGLAATASLLVPMMLPLRNRFRALRFGKPALWMQGHVWFGLLSYPLALFHAAKLSWHGFLSQVLMGVFTLLLLSGAVSLFLQKALPTANALHALSGDRRHALRQRRLQNLLNAWLLVHVPLAYTVLVLVLIHAIMAFRFTSPG
jgi:cytochrome b561